MVYILSGGKDGAALHFEGVAFKGWRVWPLKGGGGGL
jgi:hypothetical protein